MLVYFGRSLVLILVLGLGLGLGLDLGLGVFCSFGPFSIILILLFNLLSQLKK